MPDFQNTPASRAFGFGLGALHPAYVAQHPDWAMHPLDVERREEEKQYYQDLAQAQKDYEEQQREQNIRNAEQNAEKFASENPEQAGKILQIFPGLAQSKSFGNYAEIAKNANASNSLVPNLRKNLPVELREAFDRHLQTTGNPVEAHDMAEMEGEVGKQHGEMVKSGVPLHALQPGRLYTPVEAEDLVQRHKKATDFHKENYGIVNDQIKNLQGHLQYLDENQPPETETEELAEWKKQRAETAANLTSAMGHAHQIMEEAVKRGLPKPPPPPPPPPQSAQQEPANKAGSMFTYPSRKPVVNIPGVTPEYDSEFKGVPYRPKEKPTTSKASIANANPPTEQPISMKDLLNVPPEQRAAFIAEQKAKIAEREKEAKLTPKINEAWNKAVDSVDEMIRKSIPDKLIEGTNANELDVFAHDILNENTLPVEGVSPLDDAYGLPFGPTEPVWAPILKKNNIAPNSTAFVEPGSRREAGPFGLFGSQNVPYDDVFKTWARKYLESRGLLPTAEQVKSSSNLTPERREAQSLPKIEIGKPRKIP
jgi:hypothetical protein